jgi:HAD superfamily hydrolase (TIGR01490 family)
MGNAAFFDLDDTLICGNSGMRCAVYYFFRGRISLYAAFRTLFRYLIYFIGKSDPFYFFSDIYLFMKGRSVEAETRVFERFFDTKIRSRAHQDALRRIAWHKKRGDRIVIVTNSLGEMVGKAQELFGADTFISSRLEVKDGRFTGMSKVICYGEHKVTFVRAYAKKNSVNLKNCYAYSDNGSDVAMLSVVGHPVAVNPQGKLRRHARAHGWQIVKWR